MYAQHNLLHLSLLTFKRKHGDVDIEILLTVDIEVVSSEEHTKNHSVMSALKNVNQIEAQDDTHIFENQLVVLWSDDAWEI